MKALYVTMLSCLALAGLFRGAAAQNSPVIPPASTYFGDAGNVDADLLRRAERHSIPQTSGLSVGGVGVVTATAPYGGAVSPSGAGSFVAPVVSGGLLTSAGIESPYTMDRIFSNYTYYNRFQVESTSLVTHYDSFLNEFDRLTPVRQPGFNLNRFDIGLEKSIFRGAASLYIRAPFLDATDMDRNLPINDFDGIGNLNIGMKFTLYFNPENANVLAAGITVATPTARAPYYPSVVEIVGLDPNEPWEAPPFRVDIQQWEKVNPTYIQPWLAGQLNIDRFFVQGYFGVLAPTSDQVATAVNTSLAIGYELTNGGFGWLSSVTPYVNCQVLTPIWNPTSVITSYQELAPLFISFPTQVFVTEGVNIGIGERLSIFGGVVQPMAGPKAFDVGVSTGINYFF